ncbi:MAG: methyltransferase family protein [Anaerolineales bacterium]|jgi:protein-S-isoprenylcysteine O-methyltransferase Ste14
MPAYFAVLTLFLLIIMVAGRVLLLRRQGIAAMKFGQIDKTDFLLPPFAAFYFYLVLANTFHLPTVSTQVFFQSEALAWIGVLFCLAGLGFFAWSLVSFGKSFRVGIDTEHPDQLITDGVFAVSRNPIYTAFALILIGQFLIFPNWILLLYTAAGFWLFHRQVLREEDFLKEHYGQEYQEYCQRVRRYI